MKRVALLSLTLMLWGCPEHEPAALFAQVNLKLEESCVAAPEASSSVVFLPTGILDLATNRYGYIANIQLINQMPPSLSVTGFGAEEFHTETNIISILGATVNFDYEGLDVDLPQGFFAHTTVALFPEEAGIAVVNVIPPQIIKVLRNDPWLAGSKKIADPMIEECFQLASATEEIGFQGAPIGGRQVEILVKMTFEGVTIDGTLVYSNEFLYPVTVCNGCLVAPQMDSAIYLSQVLAGTIEQQTCEFATCNDGQDVCSEYSGCFDSNFEVESSTNEVLETCANIDDGSFPTTKTMATPSHSDGILGPFDPTWSPVQRLSYLQYRYAFERVNAYCFLLDEAPLWPPPH